jgi:hypothetical protein
VPVCVHTYMTMLSYSKCFISICYFNQGTCVSCVSLDIHMDFHVVEGNMAKSYQFTEQIKTVKTNTAIHP